MFTPSSEALSARGPVVKVFSRGPTLKIIYIHLHPDQLD